MCKVKLYTYIYNYYLDDNFHELLRKTMHATGLVALPLDFVHMVPYM